MGHIAYCIDHLVRLLELRMGMMGSGLSLIIIIMYKILGDWDYTGRKPVYILSNNNEIVDTFQSIV